MLSLRVDDEIELPLLLPSYAEQLYPLIDADRQRLRQWLPWVDGTRSAADSRAFAADALHKFADRTVLAVGIRYRGAWAGGSGCKIDTVNRRAEIGYWLATAYEGKGIITRTARALAHYAFDELQLNRVEIHCAPDNRRSCAVPERLGFVYEGTLRQRMAAGEGFQDMRIYAVLAEERARIR